MVVQSELENVLNRSMRDITSCFAGIQLYEQDSSLSNDICTVHTTFEGSYDDALILFADTAMFNRLARKVLHTEQVTQQDIEDAATEYFNIMPGMDGLDTARLIMSANPDAKIIMVSSLAYDDAIKEANNIGAKGFVYKPFDRDMIMSAFKNAFSQ